MTFEQLKQTGGPAFSGGELTIRDYFAGIALNKSIEISLNSRHPSYGLDADAAAARAYEIADAMIKARELR